MKQLSAESVANKTYHANKDLQDFVEELQAAIERMASLGKTRCRVEFKTEKEKEEFYPIIKEFVIEGGYDLEYDSQHDYIEFNWNRAVAQFLVK